MEGEAVLSRYKNRMLHVFTLVLGGCAGLGVAPLHAETINYHLDSPDEVKSLKSPAVWVGKPTVSGSGAAAFMPNPSAPPDYVSCGFSFPKNTPEGVLTFWVYDPIFELARNLTWLGIDIGCTQQNAEGKPIGKNYSFMDFRGSAYGGWMFGTGLLTDLRETRGIRHAGWTRFDIVNPPGAEPQAFLLCIDGHEVFRTREKLLSLTGLYISVRSLATPIYFDEVSYSTDASSYRPAVVQDILPRRVTLQPGAKFPVELLLAAQGARQDKGEVTLSVYDGAERELFHSSAKVVWAKVGTKPLTVNLPALPRSGSFWVEAAYTEKGMARPDLTRSRVDAQYSTPGFEAVQHAKLTIDTEWDFVPAATVEIPTSPPQDWSSADSLSGPWFSRNGGVKNVSLCDAAWYRQALAVPADWKDRRVLLDIDDPETVVHAFVDGKRAGDLSWPGGTLDLTRSVQAGKTFDLALFVVATPLFGKNTVVRQLLGDKYPVPPWQGTLGERGLEGEVALRSEPLGARLDGVAVRTAVEGKRLWARFDCAGLTSGQTYKVVSAASAAGALDKQLPVVAFVAKSGTESVTAETEWADPVLWDIGAPFLYSLNARLEQAGGTVLDTIRPERFGFREILTKGHLMTLNGKPLSLFDPRQVSASMTRNFGFCDWMRRWGYNSAYRTGGYASALDATFFDEAGIARRMNASDGFEESNLRLLAQYGKEQDPTFWDAYRQQIEYYIKRYRNCPSVFLWRGPYYSSESGLELNPLLQDGIWLRAPESDLDKRMIDAGYRCYKIIHALDPSRYQDDLTTLNYNDTINFHCYVGFSPIQEFIERNEHWIKYGVKPAFIDEYASPFITDWCNSPWEGGGGHTSPRKVPQVAEWCAVTKGDLAFVRDANEEAALKAFESAASNDLASVEKIADPQKRAVAQGVRSIGSAFGAYCGVSVRNPDNLRDQVWEERVRENILNWRADGVAGMCSFLGEGGNEWKLLPKYYAPVVAFLAGTPEKRTAKDHLFSPGETLRRSVLALNNGRQASKVHCEWKLTLGGAAVASAAKEFSIPGGGQILLPIEAVIPAGGDRQGELSMTLSAGGKELCSDRCAIDVLAPRPFKNLKTLALVDPEGDTARSLEKVGVKFQLLPFNADFGAYDAIVFGRRSFDYELQCLPEGLDLGALTRLGKNVLVLEQTEKTLRERFKFRTEYASPRDVYGRVGGSPLFEGLSDRCLTFWRGAATLTGGYEVALKNLQPPKGYRGGAWYPYVGNDGKEKKRYIKWGNTHTVATVVIIKPDTGNFRTLVDCEFALNYAAALEVRNARGNVVLSQLDVSGRTQDDPAAQRYLANLVSYARDLPTPAWRQAAYLGDDDGAKLLESLRIDFKRVATPADATSSGVLVLGGADPKTLAGWKAALAAFAQSGGVVFCLPKSAADFAAGFLPFAVETSVKAVNQSVLGKAADPLLLGLGNADFYWKGDIQVTALDKVEGAALRLDSGILARVPRGKGEFVLCQIAPGMFDAGKRFWLDRSSRFNERTVAGLLSNAGAEMAEPYFFRPISDLVAAPDLADGQAIGWGACGVSEADVQKRFFSHQWACPWVGSPVDAFKLEQVYAHAGPVVLHTHFPLVFPAGSTPRLLVNGLADGCVAQLNGKPIALVKERQKGGDMFSVERCFLLPPELLKTAPAHNCLILWSPAIRKAKDEKVAAVSVIIFEDPDVLEARARQQRLRAPYLHEETEDPYVARHW